jgi:carbonic anhydrase
MKSDATTAPADATPARRLTPKLLIVGGASALLLVALIGGALLLWPKSHDAAEAKAATRLAARKAAAAASAASTAPAASAAVAAASAAVAPQPDAPSTPLRTAHAAPAEEPLDRLRRRIGQTLGTQGELDAAQAGELRVLSRGAGVTAVAHAAQAAPAAPPAQHPAAADGPHVTHWSYEGKAGPQAWGRMKPEFAKCATGSRQSPIDIRDGMALDLDPVQFDYKPTGFGVIDNGHTVQVNVAPGNSIEVMGRRFELLQFHFHRPSEERINGRQFEMVAHLVHKDAEGRLAVVAVLLDRGAAQPLLQTVWNNLPLEKGEEAAARAQIDLNQLLPADRRYYTYMGSLTTPPCSEGVLWMVMQQPVQLSGQQIDIFSRLYPMNARPIQQAAGRLIKQSN